MNFKLVVAGLAVGLAACGGGQTGSDPVVGDPVVGEELFKMVMEEEPGRHACRECHSLGENSPFAPSAQAIEENAGSRIEGMSAADYLRQSIVDPSAFIVEGWRDNVMPKVYGEILTEEEIDDLIAEA